tara:strand:- start:311 stop:685 length:375 start_codon:yes stop_codon:yes gene_type:complete
MARKKQNITIIGKAANKRVERAIPKIQRELGYGKRQATAVAIRMESVGQLGMGGDTRTAKQRRSGALSVAAFAVSQMQRKRQPKKTMVVDTNPIKADSVGDYARQYRTNVPVQFTTNKKKPRKK